MWCCGGRLGLSFSKLPDWSGLPTPTSSHSTQLACSTTYLTFRLPPLPAVEPQGPPFFSLPPPHPGENPRSGCSVSLPAPPPLSSSFSSSSRPPRCKLSWGAWKANSVRGSASLSPMRGMGHPPPSPRGNVHTHMLEHTQCTTLSLSFLNSPPVVPPRGHSLHHLSRLTLKHPLSYTPTLSPTRSLTHLLLCIPPPPPLPPPTPLHSTPPPLLSMGVPHTRKHTHTDTPRSPIPVQTTLNS